MARPDLVRTGQGASAGGGTAVHARLHGFAMEYKAGLQGMCVAGGIGHCAASLCITTSRSYVTPSTPLASHASTSFGQYLTGIDPRRFISEAVVKPTPKMRATFVGPPRVSKMVETEFIPPINTRHVGVSTLFVLTDSVKTRHERKG